MHGKLTHIGSPKGDVVCVSTGNFHEGNAKLYTDVTLLTADRRITREVDAVFDFIRHPEKQVHFEQLLVSPHNMLQQLFADRYRDCQCPSRPQSLYPGENQPHYR